MVKYFNWSESNPDPFTDTIKILDAPAANKRYRIVQCTMSCNASTASAIAHEGAAPPANGDSNIIDFVDNRRTHNQDFMCMPYISSPGTPIYLTVQNVDSETSEGRGMIQYLEEAIRS